MKPHNQAGNLAELAAADRKITDGAFRLLVLLMADAGRLAGDEFPLSNKQVAELCGIADKLTIYRRIKSLCPKYLKPVGIKGCPPTAWFKLRVGKTLPLKK